MRAAGHTKAGIARATGRSDGTITRELQRNSSATDVSAAAARAGGGVSGGEAALVYRADGAHERARERAVSAITESSPVLITEIPQGGSA